MPARPTGRTADRQTCPPIGFFGKLPCLGDFASRRLPRHFVQPWDDWLQGSMAASAAQLGAAWLDTYLGSPFWRFVLAGGICGPEAWRGVLMPSVDRLGRPYPLTLAQPLPDPHGVFDMALNHGSWFAAIEDLMLAALHPQSDLDALDDALDAALRALPAPAPRGPAKSGAPTWRLDGATGSGSGQLGDWASLLDGMARGAPQRFSCWSTTGSAQVAASLVVCDGLLSAQGFAALLDGGWPRLGS